MSTVPAKADARLLGRYVCSVPGGTISHHSKSHAYSMTSSARADLVGARAAG